MGSSEQENCVLNQRTNRRVSLLILLATLCLFGATLAAEQEVQDFDFEDTESDPNIVKRTTVLSDDEDMYLGDQSSTPVLTEEGSDGTSETPAVNPDQWTWTATSTAKAPLVVDYPRYYRVIVNFTSIEYTPALEDRNSQEFKELSRVLQRDLENLLKYVLGQHSVTILQIKESYRSVLVKFDLGSFGEASEDEIKSTFLEALEDGVISKHTVSKSGYSIRAIDSEIYCPSHVGRNPDKLPRTGNNWANLLINNVFPCDGNIVGWEYYRLIPEGSAYVGVWRQHVVDSHFNLISKTELPSAPVGIREVDVSPIPVKKGDFIGIFYPRSTHENVIAQAQLADETVSSNKLYHNFHLEMYDEDVQTQNLINLEDHDYKTINATFSLRAVMDNEVGPNVAVVTRRQCGPEEFDCGDSCVSIDYRCDGQQDCNNNADEINCVPVITSPEPCLEGRFRCNDGTCIPRSQFCNGESNCPDGSDEFCGSCREEQYQCKNGQCISRVDVCNAYPDCEDYSDELPTLCISTFPTVPPVCPFGYTRCAEGTCLESCEGPLTCSSDQFRCNEWSYCYPNTMKCDGIPDCPDGADEIDCVVPRRQCGPEEFDCGNSCVKIDYRCDGQNDCNNNADEANCTSIKKPCLEGTVRCNDGTCIPLTQNCNGEPNCPDDLMNFANVV
ncbi:hypothetical protein Btru_064884 [Bulinus truncatus]|nr:hypothetical protein Btru_064884 [Bulinus truncatus]